MNTIHTIGMAMALVALSLAACASEPHEPAARALGEARAALAQGDTVIRCFQAELEPGDAPACEARSGSRSFEIEDCKLEVERTCELREIEGHFRCCCKLEVLQASDGCDDVAWSDLAGGA